MRLRLDGPLDLDATLYSGQCFRWRPDGAGHLGWVAGRPVRVEIVGNDLHAQGPGASAQALRTYFRLDGTHTAMVRALRLDKPLRRAAARFPGLRLLKQDPWEALLGFVLSQNSNEARIRRDLEAIATAAGDALDGAGRRLHALPPPQAVARLGVSSLRRLGTGYRAPYLVAAARAVATGALDLDRLAAGPYEAASGRLMRLPGVGPKVADCVLLYGCGRLDAFPADVWVRRVVAEQYYRGPHRQAPYAWIHAFALRHFGPSAGYAQHLLFHWRRTASGRVGRGAVARGASATPRRLPPPRLGAPSPAGPHGAAKPR